MCTEFFLAVIYFVTIFFVNYFLLKVLKAYFANISYLLRLQNIFNSSQKVNKDFIFFLFSFFKKENNNVVLLKNLHQLSNTKDMLIVSNTYASILKNFQSKTLTENKLYYFELLATHYLPQKKKIPF
jgi:hypothetical protein